MKDGKKKQIIHVSCEKENPEGKANMDNLPPWPSVQQRNLGHRDGWNNVLGALYTNRESYT